MTKIVMMCVCVLAACGGSGSSDTKEPVPPAEAEAAAMPAPETGSPESPPIADSVAEAKPIPEETPVVPEPAAIKPAPVVAMAEVKAIKDDASFGTITFERGEDGMITINGQFTGLQPGALHAVYIHENGDCGNKAKAVGAHLNPTKAKHGPPESSERHAGDFGNLTVDDSGAAIFAMTTDSITIEADRADSILQRAIVIHSKKDDKKGVAGAALACGVIHMRE